MTEAAGVIAGVTGRPVSHHVTGCSARIGGAAAAGAAPAGHRVTPAWRTATIAPGHGSRPTGDIRQVTESPPASCAGFAHRHAHARAVPAAHP